MSLRWVLMAGADLRLLGVDRTYLGLPCSTPTACKARSAHQPAYSPTNEPTAPVSRPLLELDPKMQSVRLLRLSLRRWLHRLADWLARCRLVHPSLDRKEVAIGQPVECGHQHFPHSAVSKVDMSLTPTRLQPDHVTTTCCAEIDTRQAARFWTPDRTGVSILLQKFLDCLVREPQIRREQFYPKPNIHDERDAQ